MTVLCLWNIFFTDDDFQRLQRSEIIVRGITDLNAFPSPLYEIKSYLKTLTESELIYTANNTSSLLLSLPSSRDLVPGKRFSFYNYLSMAGFSY